MNLFQQSMAISPSPNTLRPRQPRPQDLVYQAAIDTQDDQETPQRTIHNDPVIGLLANLTQVMRDSNKRDIALPPKFNGKDEKWEQWHKQWRAYLQAKGWLATYDHPTGPEPLILTLTSTLKSTTHSLTYVVEEKHPHTSMMLQSSMDMGQERNYNHAMMDFRPRNIGRLHTVWKAFDT